MVFLNWPELPVYWYGFQYFPYALLMVVLVPACLPSVFGWFDSAAASPASISHHHPGLTFALMLASSAIISGFGGKQRLTDFKDILGFNVRRRRRGRRCS